MSSMKIILSEQEERALKELAERELRDPRAQILLLVRRQLILLGLLPDTADIVDENAECDQGSQNG